MDKVSYYIQNYHIAHIAVIGGINKIMISHGCSLYIYIRQIFFVYKTNFIYAADLNSIEAICSYCPVAK